MIPVDDEACSNRDDANEDSEKTTQAHCHTLVTNACVLWTTKYLGLAIDDTEDAVSDEVIAPLSPAQFKHMNPYGTYSFNEEALRHPNDRPRRVEVPPDITGDGGQTAIDGGSGVALGSSCFVYLCTNVLGEGDGSHAGDTTSRWLRNATVSALVLR